jgi:hypothetical protein
MVIETAPASDMLKAAVEIFRGSIALSAKEKASQNWTGTQNNLGAALFQLAKKEKSIDLLLEAQTVIQATHSFLEDAGYSQYVQYFDEKGTSFQKNALDLPNEFCWKRNAAWG